MNFEQLLNNAICGGLAAAGFGVLFNTGFRALPWCAASGALALAVRTVAIMWGWNMEAASFVAALTVGAAVQLLQPRIAVSSNALQAVGCIPMIPGGFSTKAILGLFAVTVPHAPTDHDPLIMAVENTLRATLTIGALGTGLAIPSLLLRVRGMNKAQADRGPAHSVVIAPVDDAK
jgi:uncharacterized membrane protein YjjB (DUF3815 family)